MMTKADKQPTLFGDFDNAAKAQAAKRSQVVADAAKQQRLVYDFITSKGLIGATDNEGIEYFREHFKAEWPTVENGYRARRGELAEDTFIEKHPIPRIAGRRSHTVWIDAKLLPDAIRAAELVSTTSKED